MEPISIFGIYIAGVVFGSGIIYYYAETQSQHIYSHLERHLKQ